ncbi:alpha/beta hydrolase [Micromonospora sp. WMMD812]|uniref:alpha/beta fold hydrolase n=1 Tax=Micromonospora sp. WMMD812 TaxID=3015152 RepID=UPI00248D0BE1|nr:alpha/beta hydrolase [Micromonospora sp. WMMD812]WBB70287.1 alpha/beta hydrolase [Micromonospora sp. WMMD812]
MVKPSFPRPTPARATAVLLPVLWGLVVGWWTPRGPGTGVEAILSAVVSVAVGLAAGWLTRSRWAMLAAPVLFAVAVELVRIRLRGPTVDAPHLSGFGFAALLLGRGLHGLFTLLPLLVGAAYGAGLARRGDRAAAGEPAAAGEAVADRAAATAGRQGAAGEPVADPAPAAARSRSAWLWLRRIATGLAAAVVLLAAVAVALPARTDRIDGGIAELTSVDTGDRSLGLMLRGADPAAPVLLFLPGGPGSSEVGAVRRHLAGLEQRFVVATLDRRGAAKSWGAFAPSSSFTLDSEVADVLAVVEHLRARFRQEKVYLVAHSGGSLVGVTAVQRRPELFRAYVGVGQAVDLREADRRQHADTIAWARRTGRADLADRLTALGPPPYDRMYDYEPLLANEAGAFDYDRPGAGTSGIVDVPEYGLLEKVHALVGPLDGFDALYPTVQDVDLRRQVRQLQVPVWLVDGAHEVPGRLALLREWYDLLEAPRKERVVLDGAGHRSLFERPGPFTDLLARVRAETSGAGI